MGCEGGGAVVRSEEGRREGSDGEGKEGGWNVISEGEKKG